ncbi:MAG: 16S rRNA (uracil(1498)-N(3))-methyltransferase [Bacteroidaceae bacterium]|nr:16S rRNA (uracil(1498)-N(3))-methyltransferase [Bacteroidaceae bacterium]
MALFYVPDISERWELSEEEAAHALRVLRLAVGAELEITDGKGSLYKARIASINGKHCLVETVEGVAMPKNWKGNIHVAIAPTKNMDRMEWLAEKATEIGLDALTFLNCRFSERKVVKCDRVERIVVSAMKQSLKYHKPVVGEITDFRKFVAVERSGAKFIAHCHEGERVLLKDVLVPGEDATILIGPEGDFSSEEVDMAIKAGYVPVSLGSSRLRTETAGLVACHTYILKNEI